MDWVECVHLCNLKEIVTSESVRLERFPSCNQFVLASGLMQFFTTTCWTQDERRNVRTATSPTSDPGIRENVSKTSSKLKEVMTSNSSSPNQPTTVCGALIDQYHYVIGTERGLLYVNNNYEKVTRVGLVREIHQIECLVEDQLMIAICDKERHIRLIPSRALDGDDVDWIKIDKTKGCTRFTTGALKPKDGSSEVTRCLCIAVKQKVVLYQITNSSKRHKKLKRIRLPAPAQSLDFISDNRIIVGYPSGFTIYSVSSDEQPLTLIQPQNSPISSFVISRRTQLDALCAVEMGQNEFLLVFSLLGVYVDCQGRRTREKDITFSETPAAIVHCNGNLLVYTATHIALVDCSSGNLIQTLNMKQCRPLNNDGLLSATYVTEKPYIVYLRNKLCEAVNGTRRQLNTGENNLRKTGSESSVASGRTSISQASASSNRMKYIPSPSNFHQFIYKSPNSSPRP